MFIAKIMYCTLWHSRIKHNILTLLTAGLCSVKSPMSGKCLGTSFLHRCWVSTISLLGNHGRQAWLGLYVPHALAQADALQPRIQTFYWPYVRHNDMSTIFHHFNPNLGGYINWRFPVAKSHIISPRRPIGEREALCHATAVVGSSAPLLRKSQRPWGRLKNCLVR